MTRETGLLTQWDDAKGYGFISPEQGGARLFVHIRAFGLRPQRPHPGERLSFERGHDAQGKIRALNVRSLEPRATMALAARQRPAGSRLWLVPAFALLVLVCQLLWGLPHALWGSYMAMSLATFIVYLGDKRAASRGQWRVAENTLHLLALAGGWPGALLAQEMLRHKSSKPAFRRLFWASVLLNLLGFALIFTPLGGILLRAAGMAG